MTIFADKEFIQERKNIEMYDQVIADQVNSPLKQQRFG